MRIVLAHSKVADGVVEALDATGADWTSAFTGGGDDHYWRLLATLWSRVETFVVVEHDVLVREDTFAILESCPQPWCSWAIPYLGGEYAGMGCAKFTAELIAAVPHAVQWAGEQTNDRHPQKRHWCLADNGIRMALSRSGFSPCEHRPALGHVRSYPGVPQPSHGCVGATA